MYIRIRKVFTEDPAQDIFVNLNQYTLVKEVKSVVEQKTGIPSCLQKLFFGGKQLSYNSKMLDYGIKLNDVIQLMAKEEEPDAKKKKNPDEDKPAKDVSLSKFYEVGDLVDVRCMFLGCWFEGTIQAIESNGDGAALPGTLGAEKHLIFHVSIDTERSHRTTAYKIESMRPRSYYTYNKSELRPTQRVLVNYNFDKCDERGYWYDMIITRINKRSIVGSIYMGNEKMGIMNCKTLYINEVMRIETHTLLTKRVETPKVPLRQMCPQCWNCGDEVDVDCTDCGCKICNSKKDLDKILLCDECDDRFHMYCLTPPLENYPADADWYCSNCKNVDVIVLPENDPPEEEPSTSKSLPTGKGKTKARGMACAGRNSICTIVPLNHYGPIPGIEVGMTWKFRMQVSAAGVHRPSMAGIHGRSSDGAYSIILSGGYEDDLDDGDTIIYTGSGGRGLSGSKQNSDQKLTKQNMSLAINCYTPFKLTGAEAEEWQKGKPVRVLRSSKFKSSKYAPNDGIRYDGIYKVQKYYRIMGKSGWYVWRYVLKRDDLEPAPWAEGGQEYPIVYPDGYLEANSNKENAESSKTKRKNSAAAGPKPKKIKLIPFELSAELEELIKADDGNTGYWNECAELLKKGKQYYLNIVKETFLCVCCQDLVFNPVTTVCKHNICKNCLQRSFGCQLFNCPYCRTELGESYNLTINQNLSQVLLTLFPGYGNLRKE